MAYLTLSTVLCLLGFQCPWIVIQFGWYVSWVYLRFYKKNTTDTIGGSVTYGDGSETFSLISWFPPFMQCVYTIPNESLLTFTKAIRSLFSATLYILWLRPFIYCPLPLERM